MLCDFTKRHTNCCSAVQFLCRHLSKTHGSPLNCWQAGMYVQQSKGRTGSVQEGTKSKREELTEFVPEALKNMLLVMASQEVLTPQWQVRLWQDSHVHCPWFWQ